MRLVIYHECCKFRLTIWMGYSGMCKYSAMVGGPLRMDGMRSLPTLPGRNDGSSKVFINIAEARF